MGYLEASKIDPKKVALQVAERVALSMQTRTAVDGASKVVGCCYYHYYYY